MATMLRPSEMKMQTNLTIGFLGSLLLTSCAAAPFLVPIGIEFARNLFQTSSQNYGSAYRDNLNNLVGRLASPYMQKLPPMAGVGPGMPGQPGFQGQPGLPGQPGMPQQQYPGQQTYPGQAGTYDPNNPYGTPATAYPGASAYPGGTASPPNPYGTTPSYSGQPGMPQQQYPGQQSYPGQQTYPGQTGAYDPNNPYGAGAQNPYGQPASPYGTPSPYGQSPNPAGGQSPYGSQNPYGNSGYQTQPGQANPYGSTNPQYGSQNPYGTQNPYGAGATAQGYGQTQPGYGQAQPGYGTPSPYGTQQQQQAYGGYGTAGQQSGGQPYGGAQYGAPGIYPRGLSAEPIAVDVALVRQKLTPKGKQVVLMNDGEVLKDGGANKDAGDKFKLVVRTNCDCYLYAISIDGSGWAQNVWPAKLDQTQIPLKKDQEYAFPEGNFWYSLDQVKGIETFFIVASASRRTDLEESMAQFAGKERPPVQIVAKVEEPPVVPRGVGSVKTRGIVTVKDESGTSATVTPLSYMGSQPGQDVTVTRWFKHE